MTQTTGVPWLSWLLALLCAAAILTAVLVIGPSAQSAGTRSRTLTVQRGVVQSTVSGSGNLQAAEQLDLGFKTAGTVEHIYAREGQHVTQGQLLAELNPQSATVNLEQAKASLQAAEATLVSEQEDGGETSGSQSQGSPSARAAGYPATGSVSSAPASTAATRSTPTASKTANSTAPGKKPRRTGGSRKTSSKNTTTAGASATSQTETTRQSAATREANLASARAAVKSDRLAVQSDEQSVVNTRLYAPFSGTIVSLSGEVGETVSGAGTSKASSASSSSSSSGSSSSGVGGGASRSAGASSNSSGSSSSDSSFAVLSDLSRIDLVVPLSESEIVHVHTGQPATVTVEALEGVKLAAHVASVATLSSSNSGVVSYDVTFGLDQLQSGLKPGMSASAEVVVRQAEGVNVPSSAISAGTVTVVSAGKQVRRTVLTGLAGNSSTIILRGLRAGEQIALPVASAGTGASLLSRLPGRSGGALGGLGGGGFAARGFGGVVPGGGR